MPVTKSTSGEPIEIHSGEVQEIISHIPGWIIRWGITLIFVVFLVLLCISWFVKYPDVIRAKVYITSDPAPVMLLTNTAGRLKLLKNENDPVSSGEAIAYIQSEIKYEHIKSLERILKHIKVTNFDIAALKKFSSSSDYQLGSLSSFETALRRDIENWLKFTELQASKKQIDNLQEQLSIFNDLIQIQQERQSLYKNELQLNKENYLIDSLLYSQQVISKVDFTRKKSEFLKELMAYRNAEATLHNNQLQAKQIKGRITELELSNAEEKSKLFVGMKNSLNELMEQISQWKQQYVLTAIFQGKVAYLDILQDGKYIEAGTALFSILPESTKIFAYAELPLTGSGKVKTGQKVNIRLESYPFEQYGLLTGRVKELSSIPGKQGYIVKLNIPDGLLTTYQKKLPFRQNMTGETEIITEDLRLLERVFYRFRKILKF